MDKAMIIAGSYGSLIAREKAGEPLELGELLVSHDMLLQVTNLSYGSQISQQNRELISGLAIEDQLEVTMQDQHLKTYTLATLKALVRLPSLRPPKGLPPAFSMLREVTNSDIKFEQPQNALFLGKLRSGSSELDVPVFVSGKDVLTHHVLVAATTGRGKSNLMKVLLQDLLEKDFASILVFDPHAEYASALVGKKLSIYSKDPKPGEYSLKVNLATLRPSHFDSVAQWSDAQRDSLRLYYKRYKDEWIERIIVDETPITSVMEGTLGVLKRKLSLLLSVDSEEGVMVSRGVFDMRAGRGTMSDIAGKLASGAVVVIETASLSDAAEVLMATLISTEVYEHWKRLGLSRTLSICLEEAPRFIGADALKEGPNVFSQIAREGRKFNVGLIGITQLPSLIPRQVLANMNTKIILGIEMAPERKAIIESAPQDLSADDRVIASLEKGEAIVSSTFTHFAIPIKIPLHKKKQTQSSVIVGMKQ